MILYKNTLKEALNIAKQLVSTKTPFLRAGLLEFSTIDNVLYICVTNGREEMCVPVCETDTELHAYISASAFISLIDKLPNISIAIKEQNHKLHICANNLDYCFDMLEYDNGEVTPKEAEEYITISGKQMSQLYKTLKCSLPTDNVRPALNSFTFAGTEVITVSALSMTFMQIDTPISEKTEYISPDVMRILATTTEDIQISKTSRGFLFISPTFNLFSPFLQEGMTIETLRKLAAKSTKDICVVNTKEFLSAAKRILVVAPNNNQYTLSFTPQGIRLSTETGSTETLSDVVCREEASIHMDVSLLINTLQSIPDNEVRIEITNNTLIHFYGTAHWVNCLMK